MKHPSKARVSSNLPYVSPLAVYQPPHWEDVFKYRRYGYAFDKKQPSRLSPEGGQRQTPPRAFLCFYRRQKFTKELKQPPPRFRSGVIVCSKQTHHGSGVSFLGHREALQPKGAIVVVVSQHCVVQG
eukprot:TRINITY_DN4321_c0_g3_i1.p1 TRINITY_DN4321_c0_g3~~TRINITY_DN4321_c0_g3_i1.p1  ORF type:complete len:127 (+),score=14.61 TRINITY_DN4321_c0_g3_i1:222-602(+)